ncbi:cytochrome P450 family protein [Streptomyces sp. 4N509B]|uniref:cytochrome P450 family protein n=1 Tax=Streptomyces sp. 4N509B TaxID=3457413 RepID=UPI003FD1D794
MTDKCPIDHGALFDEDYFADPYRVYETLHAEAPVHRIQLPDGTPTWLVTEFVAAREALRDPRLVRSHDYAGEGMTGEVLPEPMRAGNLLTEDPPAHTRLRQFMNFAFTPRRIEALRPRVQEIIDGCLDTIEGRGEADLMNALAAPLPIAVIAELLGVPPELRGEFRGWADSLLGDDQAASRRAGAELLRFAHELLPVKRANPGDDLISYWVSKADAGEMTPNELVGMVFILILGGFDTTVGTIGNAVAALLAEPEKAEALRADPDRVPAALEEILRYDGSVHSGVRRFAAEDIAIGGTRISAGDAVLVSIGAANQDPVRYAEPRTMDFSREAERHLAFGIGTHHCIGAELARMEIAMALTTLLRRFPRLALAEPVESLVWRRSFVVRVLKRLPVVF